MNEQEGIRIGSAIDREKRKFRLACAAAAVLAGVCLILIGAIVKAVVQMAILFLVPGSSGALPEWTIIMVALFYRLLIRERAVLWLFSAEQWKIRKNSPVQESFRRLRGALKELCKLFRIVYAAAVGAWVFIAFLMRSLY